MTSSSSPDLPRWDLNSRFGFDSPLDSKIDDLLKQIEADSKAFRETYEHHLSDDKGAQLLAAIEEYERICVSRATVASYLSLSYDTQLHNDGLKKRKGQVSQQQSAVMGDFLEWFTLDLAALPQEKIKELIESTPDLSTKYQAFLDDIQRSQPHDLSKEVERALTVRSPYSGTRPLVSFLDKELSLMKFDIPTHNEPINMEVLLSQLSSSKDATVRAACLKSLNDGLGNTSTARVAALSLSAVAGSWLIENQERQYSGLRSRRNLSNNCPDAVVDSLLKAVRSVGVTYCKRYYAMKKTILQQTQGLDTFRWSDRNAPMDIQTANRDETKTAEGKISWGQAVSMVESGYRKFSPKMADMFVEMVKEERIDVPAADGKKGGAYCSGVVPGIGPFQLLNFDGTQHDVSTLAHESGHACHDILAYKQGYLQYHPPLTLAETASIFGEMIVFRDLLALAQEDPRERLTLLMSKIDDVINSVVRQCSFDRFEELAHTARDKGELSVEELNGAWSQAMVEYYGTPARDGGDSPFDDYDDTAYLWSYVPHFHHVPFYVYSYAFADLVVGSLYNSFQKNPDGFEERLLDLLSAGGTRDFATALAPFGLDPTSPSFWEEALEAHLGALMQEAETIATELGYSGSK